MAKPDKWVDVIDGAGIKRRVRRVDAREIEEGKARRAAAFDALGLVDPARVPGESVAEPVGADRVPGESLIEVDDQSIEPKVSKKKK